MLSFLKVLWRQLYTARLLHKKGVVLKNPFSVFISKEVLDIGAGTVIYPNTTIEGKTIIGKNCIIGPNVHIKDSYIADDCRVGTSAHVEGSFLDIGCTIEHMQIKRSRLGPNVTAKHFGYLGDAEVGEGSNIGAGVVTCNFNGKHKRQTAIGKNVFVGVDTLIVAPLTMGDESASAAGSVLTEDVPPGALAIRRPREQVNKPSYSRKEADGWKIGKRDEETN